MKVLNHTNFAMCKYNQTGDISRLGDIVKKVDVYNKTVEIGVIIQAHEDGDFRADMFGNFSPSEVTMATMKDIKKYQPDLIPYLTKDEPKFDWEENKYLNK